jgi:hypothetical protein
LRKKFLEAYPVVGSAEKFLMAMEIARLRESLRLLREDHSYMKKVIATRDEALRFYAEPFTWSRVHADILTSHVPPKGIENMYAGKARKACGASESPLPFLLAHANAMRGLSR